MAKKNLSALMSGIMGDSPATEQSSEVIPTPKEPTEQLRYKKVGRPSKSEHREPSQETRATFILPTDILWKLKFIGLIDNRLIKDVVGTALKEYVNKWEKENGPIKPPK